MNWAGWVAGSIGAWAKKALGALGIGLVSYLGFEALAQQVAAAVQGALSGLAADVYQILALGGMMTVMNIWLAAITTVVTLMGVQRFGVLTK